MADEPQKRLEAYAQRSVPAVDPGFADQLESKLRVEHAAQSPAHRGRIGLLLPRLVTAAIILAAGGLGIAALSSDDSRMEVALVDDRPLAPVDAAAGGSDDEQGGTDRSDPADPGQAIADPTTPASTAPPLRSVTPGTVVSVPPVAPSATTVRSPTESAATPGPAPSPTVTVTATPTVEREPVPLELMCAALVGGDSVGVVCSWRTLEPDRTIASYRVTRSRNGGDAQVVALQRLITPLSYIDRDVDFGDQVIYIVHGLDAYDIVVAASIREIVMVPPQG